MTCMSHNKRGWKSHEIHNKDWCNLNDFNVSKLYESNQFGTSLYFKDLQIDMI